MYAFIPLSRLSKLEDEDDGDAGESINVQVTAENRRMSQQSRDYLDRVQRRGSLPAVGALLRV